MPSLPGYAFSTPLSATGWTMGRTARAWVELMRRLGYERYGVHGGDIGAGVSGMVGGLDGEHVIGVHVVTDPLTAANVATFIPGMADRLDEDDPVDRLILERMEAFPTTGPATWRSRTPGRRRSGTAWSTRRCCSWPGSPRRCTSGPICRSTATSCSPRSACTGSPGRGASAAHTLYEQAHSSDWGAPPTVPQGFAVFGADETVRKLMPAPADAHWTEFAHGLHFPAMEAPADLAADLRAFFGPLR